MRIFIKMLEKELSSYYLKHLDDLWHLSHIIEPGDLVSSRTTRRIQDTTGERLRSDWGIKKTFFIGYVWKALNSINIQGNYGLLGVIEKGPEGFVPLGSHHTLI